ncbi:MAG: hypothetical protein C0401_00070 [Anaerolinea sp.]|nr:hypothetical protein [Anaerolinea sp.]
MIILPQSIAHVQQLIQPGENYYLVGGAVRDALLNKCNNDLDIICPGGTQKIARRLADQTSGAFYILDKERNTSRVIINESNGDRIVFDFTQLRGGSLEADLRERDFTINAMAVNLTDPVHVIDPLKGGRDLLEKWLRPCSGSSFRDDPLRVIRAIRYSVALDLKMESSTIQELKETVVNLDQISKERKRDEFFKILGRGKTSVSVQLLHSFGILPFLGIENLTNFAKVLQRLRVLDSFMSYLGNDSSLLKRDYFQLASFISGLGKQRKNLSNYLAQPNHSYRTRKDLDHLGAFLWDTSHVDECEVFKKLALSNDESTHLYILLKNRNWLHEFVENGGVLDNRIIFQYFKRLGDAGLDLALLTLADTASVVTAELNHDLWLLELEVCGRLIETWFEHPEVVDPKMLLSGTDLLIEFDLTPGPLIGQLLENLREEQAAGEVLTRQEALDWVEEKKLK